MYLNSCFKGYTTQGTEEYCFGFHSLIQRIKRNIGANICWLCWCLQGKPYHVWKYHTADVVCSFDRISRFETNSFKMCAYSVNFQVENHSRNYLANKIWRAKLMIFISLWVVVLEFFTHASRLSEKQPPIATYLSNQNSILYLFIYLVFFYFKGLEKCVTQGSVRSLGVSNFNLT